jgi:hypothetical protein
MCWACTSVDGLQRSIGADFAAASCCAAAAVHAAAAVTAGLLVLLLVLLLLLLRDHWQDHVLATCWQLPTTCCSLYCCCTMQELMPPVAAYLGLQWDWQWATANTLMRKIAAVQLLLQLQKHC